MNSRLFRRVASRPELVIPMARNNHTIEKARQKTQEEDVWFRKDPKDESDATIVREHDNLSTQYELDVASTKGGHRDHSTNNMIGLRPFQEESLIYL